MTEKINCNPEFIRKARTFLLWLINKKSVHGYEIIKLLRKEGHPHAYPARLYPLLKSMLDDLLISQKEVNVGLRVRKIYKLTQKGKRELKEGKKMFTGIFREFLREMVG